MPHYKATDEIRHRFARPWGTLVPSVGGDKDLTAKKVFALIQEKCGGGAPIIIAIGDVVTDSFCGAKIPLQIAIIDGKTKRGFFSGKTCAFDAFKTVKNPAGEITEEAWVVVKEVISKRISTLISVDGEEDLLVVPVVMEVPGHIMGSGIGGNFIEYVDYDIQTTDPRTVEQYGLKRLRIGDLVAIRDHYDYYGRGRYEGAVTIGVCIHGFSDYSGHGPGLNPVLSALPGRIKTRLDPNSNVAYAMGIREKPKA